MLVYINERPHNQNKENDFLNLLLDQLALPTKGVAVAVNGEVVPQRSWHEYMLHENDKITLIKATQGG